MTFGDEQRREFEAWVVKVTHHELHQLPTKLHGYLHTAFAQGVSVADAREAHVEQKASGALMVGELTKLIESWLDPKNRQSGYITLRLEVVECALTLARQREREHEDLEEKADAAQSPEVAKLRHALLGDFWSTTPIELERGDYAIVEIEEERTPFIVCKYMFEILRTDNKARVLRADIKRWLKVPK